MNEFLSTCLNFSLSQGPACLTLMLVLQLRHKSIGTGPAARELPVTDGRWPWTSACLRRRPPCDCNQVSGAAGKDRAEVGAQPWLSCSLGVGTYMHLFPREKSVPHHELGVPAKQPVCFLDHLSLGGRPPLWDRMGRRSPERNIASSHHSKDAWCFLRPHPLLPFLWPKRMSRKVVASHAWVTCSHPCPDSLDF